jgi:glutaminyl-tRNA synthetase
LSDEEKIQSNFIYDIIDEDIAEGRHERGAIQTRFPPEPNGYLHIGHAKAICINFLTAEKYSGRCDLRFDDTNPVKEDTEYVDSIQEDVAWLGFKWEALHYASEYFPKMYECACELISKGLAYVDDQTADEIRGTRGTLTEPGSDSPFRNRSPEENLEIFTQMKEGKFADGERVLRAKIDMAAANMNMRDPVIYRISHTEHHNTGSEWCVYPMYDFAHPLEDAIEGVTHSLCTLEFEDHRPLYDWVLEKLEWPRPPRQIEFARLGLTGTVMSKRYLKELVDSGAVESWDDPRMPTIAGLRRRGYTPESIRAFCEAIGVSKSNSLVDSEFLDHFVRDDLKTRTESRNVIFNPIKVTITNYPEGQIEQMTMENNREVPEMGERTVPFSRELYVDGEDFMEEPAKKYFRLFPGNEVRLKGAYFIVCNDFKKDDDGNVIELLCTYDPATKSGGPDPGRKVKGTIHWVEASTAVKITVREYSSLMITDEQTGEQVLNPESLTLRECIAEPSINEAEPGERFQFFRHGYYVADSKLNNETEKVFNSIVGLKSSFKVGG